MFSSGLGMPVVQASLLPKKLGQGHLPGVNFSKYHTYRWVEDPGQHPDSTLDAQIKQAVDSQLVPLPVKKWGDPRIFLCARQVLLSRTKGTPEVHGKRLSP